jgi:RNA polymerase sigma-70 factor (ECF subfamily)
MGSAEGTPEERAATSTSRSLLARVHGNDAAAWERLLSLYTPLVWHWCRKMDLPSQDMADVFQEVFQSVAVHIRDFHHDRPGDTFRGWLRTITRNKVHDHFRVHKKEPQAAGGSEANAWWSRLADGGARSGTDEEHERYDNLFRRALELIQAEFKEQTWRAFWRVVVDGQAPQIVAEELKISPGSVRVAKCRVLHRLGLELGDLRP